METRKNLCAMLPLALHTRVRQEQEKAGMTLGEYVEAMITEYYDWNVFIRNTLQRSRNGSWSTFLPTRVSAA